MIFDLVFVSAADISIEPTAMSVVKSTDAVPLTPYKEAEGLTRTTSAQGRNLVDSALRIFTNEPLFDEHGNNYPVRSIKGMEIGNAVGSVYPIEPNGIRINGMMDASTFYRVSKASKLMRDVGILTEYPFFHARPKKFPINGPYIAPLRLLPFKYEVFEKYIAHQKTIAPFRNEEGQLVFPKGRVPDHAGRVGFFAQALIDMKFGVMYRGMLSNVRLGELEQLKMNGTLDNYVADAIRALQERAPKHFKCWEQIDKLDPNLQADRDLYLKIHLPALIAENLARFHNEGFFHKYLHPNNWTLCGEIVDLDSIRNVKIDEEDALSINPNNFYYDFRHTTQWHATLKKLFDLDDDGLNPTLDTFVNHYFTTRAPAENSVMLEKYIAFLYSVDPARFDIGIPPRIIQLDDEGFNIFVRKLADIISTLQSNEKVDTDMCISYMQMFFSEMQKYIQPQFDYVINEYTGGYSSDLDGLSARVLNLEMVLCYKTFFRELIESTNGENPQFCEMLQMFSDLVSVQGATSPIV